MKSLFLLTLLFLQSPPKYEWITQTESFVLKSGQYWALLLPENKTEDHKVRVSVTSESPVSFGFAEPDSLKAADRATDPFFELVDLSDTECLHTAVLKTTAQCSVGAGEPAAFVVRDDRTRAGNAANAAAAYIFKSRKYAEKFSSNRITVVFSIWRCVENCPR